MIHTELKVPILLLFDEGNVLAQNRVLLEKLRNVFMNTPGFMLVITGTPDFFPVMDDVFSPIVRQFKKINVGEFIKVDDTRNCIRKPLEKLGIVPEEIFDFETYRDVQDIHNLSGGRPYEIQLICHMLFRRVQFKRAENMKLDFSVLEEIRKELETSQDITSRPILNVVLNLSEKQLYALGILCSCDGHATFDQVWVLQYIFHGESSWTKDELEKVLMLNVDNGILNVNNGLISFAGDDFDRIYVKYYAREQGIMSSFSSISVEARWQEKLNDFVNLHMKDRMQEIFALRLYKADNDISAIIQKMASQNSSEDVFVDSLPLSLELYLRMLEYQGQATIPTLTINPGLPWLNLQSFYQAVKPIDSESFEEATNQVNSLSERITKLGGNLVVARRDFPVIPMATLIDKVEHTANENLRTSLGFVHEMSMYQTYNDLSKREEAFIHADAAYRFNPKPKITSCNNIAYVFFAANELNKAEFLFNQAINLSKLDDSEKPLFPALPTYNLGVLRAERGQLQSALADFQICFNLVQGINAEDRVLSCLWVPILDDEVLTFEERRDPDLLETVEEAKAAIEYIIAKKADS